jgi:hypothetical protein
MVRDCLDEGFRFTETETLGGTPYGCARTSPSWMMKLVEPDTTIRVLGLHEGAWVDNLVIQRRPIV